MGFFFYIYYKCEVYRLRVRIYLKIFYIRYKGEEKERGWGLGRRGGREKGRKEK